MARQDDRQKPMDMRAVHTDGFYNPNSVTTLSGQVVIAQGTLKVTGDLAKIYVDADQQISRIVITGKPAHIQQLDDHGNLMAGDALTLDYDNVNGIATLITQAVVRQQGRGEAHGDKLTYNTQTSEMTGSSGSDGLVHMIFLPKPKPSTAPAAGSKPAPAASTSQLPQGQP
ncbi:MAG: lipopolysaccharide transport periplasmic protein LptA [Rhodanobacter sp.]|jgi:lipopolysaccharide export system protein LptA|nr:lipopolysaccharide transport periplasmic protein LptA [Rhodanobacter sp.]